MRLGKGGFTLLEVLIAMALAAVGPVIMIGLFSTAFVSSIDPEKTNIAMNLAQGRLEEIRNLDFETEIVSEPKSEVSGFPEFQRSVTVTSPETDLKQVTVDVYWSFKGGESTTSLVTYLSKN